MSRIVRDPGILLGKPTIKGTRIPVTLIVNLVAHGQTVEDIMEGYPHLTKEDIKAALEYAEKAVDKAYPANPAILHEVSPRRKH
jgi:uncharacterized protein (DUF433 family)